MFQVATCSLHYYISTNYLWFIYHCSFWTLLFYRITCVSWFYLYSKNVSLGFGNKYVVFKQDNFHFRINENLMVY